MSTVLKSALETAEENEARAVLLDPTGRRDRAQELYADGIFYDVAEAERFVELEANAKLGSKLSQEMAQWLDDSRQLIVETDKIRAKRAEAQSWNRRLASLQAAAAKAEQSLQRSTARLAAYDGLDDASFVRDYIEHDADGEFQAGDLGIRFAQNHLAAKEYARLLHLVVAERRHSATAARRAVESFTASVVPAA